jgi:Flp pilus assembly protein CpaB
MTYRLRNIVLAVGLAALAALLTSFYVANYKRTVQQDEASVTVYVAAKEIPAGTPGSDVVDLTMLRSEKVARRSVVPGAISNPSQVQDLVAVETVYEGEQLSVNRFKPVEAAGIRAELKGNLRAVQVDGSANALILGTLKRGDHIDLVATFKIERENSEKEEHVSRIVLRNLLVLRAPSSEGASEKLAANGGDVNLQVAVTDAQSQKLEYARKVAEGWTFALRPVADATDSAERLETINTMLCDGMRPGAAVGYCTRG